MSLQISSPPKTERQELSQLRRQSVFMFIATHLAADGCFSESMTYIAATVAGSNRHSVQYAVESLIETGDVIVVESGRRDAKGKSLPNRLRPVPVRTFWVREWVRNGSKTAVSTSASSAHGEKGGECSREKTFNSQDLTKNPEGRVPMGTTRASAHKNSTLYTESPHSLSVGLQSIAGSIRSSAHGFTKCTKLDPPVQQAICRLREQLAAVKAKSSMYHESAVPSALKAEVLRIEQSIAELEARTECRGDER